MNVRLNTVNGVPRVCAPTAEINGNSNLHQLYQRLQAIADNLAEAALRCRPT